MDAEVGAGGRNLIRMCQTIPSTFPILIPLNLLTLYEIALISSFPHMAKRETEAHGVLNSLPRWLQSGKAGCHMLSLFFCMQNTLSIAVPTLKILGKLYAFCFTDRKAETQKNKKFSVTMSQN